MVPNTRSATKWLIVAFAVSRIFYERLGVTFDTRPLEQFWQYIDPALLRSDPLPALWFSHTQPPLFNAFLAAVLQVMPENSDQVFRLIYLLLGVALLLGSHRLALRIGASPRAAFLIALVVACNPTTVLMENWLFYPLPVATLLVYLALAMARLRREQSVAAFGVVVILCVTMTLLRSSYHPIWLIPTLTLAWLVGGGRDHRRAFLLAATVCFLPLGWMAKNQALYDEFSLSSWSGMNLARVTVEGLEPVEREDLISSGVLSPLARERAYRSFDVYEGYGYACDPSIQSPVVSEALKENGDPNFNYECYLPVYGQYGADAFNAVRTRPAASAGRVWSGFHTYLRPSHIDGFVLENHRALRPMIDVYSGLALGQWLVSPAYSETPPGEDRRANEPISPIAAAAISAALGWGVVASIRWRRGRLDDSGAVVLFIALGVLYATIVGSAADLGENYRFRFEVEPLTFIVLGVASERALSRYRRWKAPSRGQISLTGTTDSTPQVGSAASR